MAKILVAVPDRDKRELYIFALRFAGHQLFGASDIQEVEQLVRENRIELALMDVSILKEVERAPRPISPAKLDLDIPIIYLGDQERPPEKLHSIKSTVWEYLSRPLSLDQLTKRVNQALKKAKKR